MDDVLIVEQKELDTLGVELEAAGKSAVVALPQVVDKLLDEVEVVDRLVVVEEEVVAVDKLVVMVEVADRLAAALLVVDKLLVVQQVVDKPVVEVVMADSLDVGLETVVETLVGEMSVALED